MPRDRKIRHRRPLALEPLERRALLASLMVTNTLDSGAGSLRQAITAANAAAGASTIGFAIAGSGVRTITPATDLPAISKPLTIDGTTEPGYAGSPVIVLEGPGSPQPSGSAATVGSGLVFVAGSDGSVVQGLAIDRFGSIGIDVLGTKVAIRSNFIGVDPSGLAAGNAEDGIDVLDSSGFLAAGQTATAGATISGNEIGGNKGSGIGLFGPVGVAVAGNFIGTDSSGKANLGNGGSGIAVQVGGSASTASNNLIANNGQVGILDGSDGGLTQANNTLTNNGTRTVSLAVVASAASFATTTGRTITETYTITNNGPAAATDLALGIGLLSGTHYAGGHTPPPASTVVAITAVQPSQGTVSTYTQGEGGEAYLGTLAPGASATVVVTGTIIGSGSDTLIASTVSDQVTGQAQVNVPVTATGTSDLAVAAQAPATPVAGQPETFTFTVTNDGAYTSPALLAVQFTTAAGTAATTSVVVSQGTITPLPAYLNGYGGDLVSLAPGASATVTATIVAPSSGAFSAAVFAYSPSDADPAPANNLAFAATQVPAGTTMFLIGGTALPTSGPVSAISLYFTVPLNAAQAQNVANYKVVGGSTRAAVRSATYNAATWVVTLRLARTLPRSSTPITLTVSGLLGIVGLPFIQPTDTLSIARG